MRKIVTVTGEIPPEELGHCQCHEHIVMRRGTAAESNAALCIDDLEKSTEEVRRYREAGGGSLIDAQPLGCCRDAAWLRKIGERTGVHILASTGFHKLGFYPADHWIHAVGERELAVMFEEELTGGMYLDGDDSALPAEKTGIRAGIVKTAYDTEGLTPRYRCLFRAAAAAACRTDAVMMIHVELETDPVPLQDFLLAEGMRPERLMFCHMDRACRDLGLHRQILEKGSYLEFDTIGRFKYHSDERELEMIREHLRAGFGGRLLYALDTTRARLKAYDPSAVGLDYILTCFNEKMRRAGISDAEIRQIAVETPRELLAG